MQMPNQMTFKVKSNDSWARPVIYWVTDKIIAGRKIQKKELMRPGRRQQFPLNPKVKVKFTSTQE